jgi:sphingomyelin phosphodiesterase
LNTAESGIEAMIAKDPDFIIWTGDNIDHYIFLQTFENQFFNQRVLKKYVVETLNYTKPIYPVLGNHEGVPTDIYNITQHQWVLQTFADIWIDHLTPEAHHNLSNFGYYHMQHLDTNLRIVGIFSLVYDIQNWHLVPNHTDPLGELDFLESTFAYCEQHGEVAYILGHIPIGDVFVLGEWSVRFRALINRYTNIVRGQFYGHTHYDEFKNIKSYKEDEKSAGIVWATPSFTSYPYKEPSLRIWEVDAKTWHVWDYHQYRLYLDKANKAVEELKKRNPSYKDAELKATAKWEVAYTFRDYHGISMEFEEIARYIDRIKTDRKIATKVIKMMHCEGPDSEARQDEQNWVYCRFANSVFDDHWACNGHTGNMVDYLFQGIQILHGNSGDWWHKEPVEKYTRQA